jgi:hypothetical protein
MCAYFAAEKMLEGFDKGHACMMLCAWQSKIDVTVWFISETLPQATVFVTCP